MTENSALDPRKLSFSQAQGYEPIPGPLALGELSDEARRKLWDLLALYAWASDDLGASWYGIFLSLHRDFWERPIDEFRWNEDTLAKLYKNEILNSLPFNKIFDLFQMVMRHRDCPRAFTSGIASVFKECRLAYVVDTKRPATILPAATKQEGEAIIGAIKELREAGLHGAETHLKKAGELVNEGDWPGAVRESINAVESVARQLDPKSSNTLPGALKSLQKSSGRLHPALKGGFEKLYSYTSDAEGIRHALLTNATSPAGKDEAVFMLGACASFASYLWRRHQTGS